MSKLEDTLKSMKYDDRGLLTAVVVDATTKQVLQVAFMNAQALAETIRTGKTHFWAVYADCDADAVVVEVDQHGGACHEGYRSCFYRRLTPQGDWEIVGQKVFDPKQVYKNKG
ncbi:MAG: phosphoribosyl-AMP cyclohydrolase [Phycisphaerae bacterium]